jgi:hypothetical protein
MTGIQDGVTCMFVTTVRIVDFVCALQVHRVVIIPHSEDGMHVDPRVDAQRRCRSNKYFFSSKFCVDYVTDAYTDGSYVLASPIWQVVEQTNT